MAEPPKTDEDRHGLNPALKAREETTHGTATSTPPPSKSVSVQREEGRGWPIVWAVVTIAGIVIALWILFF